MQVSFERPIIEEVQGPVPPDPWDEDLKKALKDGFGPGALVVEKPLPHQQLTEQYVRNFSNWYFVESWDLSNPSKKTEGYAIMRAKNLGANTQYYRTFHPSEVWLVGLSRLPELVYKKILSEAENA